MPSLLRTTAMAYGVWNRRRKLELMRSVGQAVGARRVLVVGVNPRSEGRLNNLIEDGLRGDFAFVVGSGLRTPDVAWDRFVVADGRLLPFCDDAFDLVVSNAVIEHVGEERAQQRFVDECVRVARAWVITTPNRTFPVESHEHTLVSHWRDAWRPSRSTVTRLLGPAELAALLPEGSTVIGRGFVSPTLTAIGRR